MEIKNSDLFSKATPTSTIGKIVQFPLIRILIAKVFLTPALAIHQLTSKWVKAFPEPYNPWLSYSESLVLLIPIAFCYWLYVRLIEKRPVVEFSLPGMFAEFGSGLGIGAVLMASTVGVLAIAGGYHISSCNGFTPLLNGLIFLGTAALVEELLFRAIIFKLIEEYFGSWVGIVVMAILFGLIHLGNPNATAIAGIAIMLETGLLLGAVYMYTRRIWMVWGIHLAWNFIQSTIFGINVSGIELGSVITPEIKGPVWLTGGEFGVEASLQAVVFCLIAGVIILKLAIAKGQMVQPVWVRKKAAAETIADQETTSP